MDAQRRAQIRLILDDVEDRSKIAIGEKTKGIFADHAAKGLLRSGATVRAVLRAVEEVASELISSALDRVTEVAKDVEAFAMIQESSQRFQSILSDQLDLAIKMATDGAEGTGKLDSVSREAQRLFRETQGRIARQLEIHRFVFIVPTPATALPIVDDVSPAATSLQLPPKKVGGRPAAPFWDDLWAAIAAALYTGDLTPKSQADIERAMASWIDDNGHSAATSSVRARARRIWDLIGRIDT